MNVFFDPSLASKYTSKSQAARVLTESWTAENMYCPVCGNPHISKFPNNRAVADFYCDRCKSEFEQKSKDGMLGSKIVDGAYNTFVQRICGNNNPDFFIMSYSFEKMNVENMYFIPKFFFVPEIIEQRKPLSPTARRSGWIGCNILLDKIPLQGRIPIIQNSVPVDKQIVINQVNKANRIRTADLSSRGWMFDILHCINGVDGDIFTLEEIYRYETVLLEKYPCNHNIRAKIRQQLQLLRDKGFITFLGNGVYQKCGF